MWSSLLFQADQNNQENNGQLQEEEKYKILIEPKVVFNDPDNPKPKDKQIQYEFDFLQSYTQSLKSSQVLANFRQLTDLQFPLKLKHITFYQKEMYLALSSDAKGGTKCYILNPKTLNQVWDYAVQSNDGAVSGERCLRLFKIEEDVFSVSTIRGLYQFKSNADKSLFILQHYRDELKFNNNLKFLQSRRIKKEKNGTTKYILIYLAVVANEDKKTDCVAFCKYSNRERIIKTKARTSFQEQINDVVLLDEEKNLYAVIFAKDEGYFLLEFEMKTFQLNVKGCCYKNQGIQINKGIDLDDNNFLVVAETYHPDHFPKSIVNPSQFQAPKEYILIKQNKKHEWDNKMYHYKFRFHQIYKHPLYCKKKFPYLIIRSFNQILCLNCVTMELNKLFELQGKKNKFIKYSGSLNIQSIEISQDKPYIYITNKNHLLKYIYDLNI